MSSNQTFGGNSKVGTSILGPPEKRLIAWLVPRVPAWISSAQLTLATIPISIGIILAGYAARFNINWLWAFSFLIFLQWLTDSLDGSVGRHRNTGLIRWGYYMDHLLDYVFLFSILLGYALLYPGEDKYLQFLVLAIFSVFMINSFLDFAATNEFRISYFGFGPTEARIVFIVVNALIILFSSLYLGWLLPWILIASLIGLIIVVARTQKQLWDYDMAQKVKKEATPKGGR